MRKIIIQGACKDQERNFLPSLMDFFGDPIEEMKPGSGVEAEYKKVNREGRVLGQGPLPLTPT